MNVEPMINARFKRFREAYELTKVPDGEAFERFVIHSVLSGHQPDAFGADSELLDQICVGGPNDMGIDGLAIKLNGLLVKSKTDVDDILGKYKRANVEFIFIQSKYKPSFDSAEFGKFAVGVRDFLSDQHFQPRNAKIDAALATKDYLLSDDVVVMWENNPAIRLYYVAMGKWRDTPHITALAEQLKKDLSQLPTYGEAQIHFVDAEALRIICDNNENTFSASIETIDSMSLTEVEGVSNSCIALCYASEFMKLLTTEEGVIRKSLFDDNVRDYQGSNSVNDEIARTIHTDPKKFGLLNNGITIVCDEFKPSNRRIMLTNPQIVNGCQTSHVLFEAKAKGAQLNSVPLHVKIISTKDPEVTNQIVRGTNRQNIVLDEAFESTKKFHKDLEEFFIAVAPEYGRVYYERRSKQYQHDPRIRPTDKVNLRILTQFGIGMFLNHPHLSHRHEAKLLKDYEDRIFQEHQSKLPYFVVALTFVKMERLFREDVISKRALYSYRAHLTMVLRELIAGPVPSLNNEQAIDKYCQRVLAVIAKDPELFRWMAEAVAVFERARTRWVVDLRRSADGIKDIPDFTALLLEECRGTSTQETQTKPAQEPEDNRCFGEVKKVIIDRNGESCGFIRRTAGDVFFHTRQNPELSFENLAGRLVSYHIMENPRTGQYYAVDVEVMEDRGLPIVQRLP